MRTVSRWFVGLVAIVHGLVHLMGVVEGFGWSEMSQLTEPISTSSGVAWLVAAVVVTIAGVMVLGRRRGWWVAAAVAAVVSQAVIVTSWTDAKAGTAANVLLAVAAIYGFRSQGSTSCRARFRRLADETVGAARSAAVHGGAVVTEDDLRHLPTPVAEYVRAAGAVGRPRVLGFRAAISGRIRGARTNRGCPGRARRSTPSAPGRAGCSSWTRP
jgi:hypothetical protein